MLRTTAGEHETDFGVKNTMKPVSMQVKRKMVAEVGVTALYVYEYYVRSLGWKGYVLTDDKVANALGISTQIVKRNRLKLTKANYFFEMKTTGKGVENYYYALGREAVMRVKYYDRIFNKQTSREIKKHLSQDEILTMIQNSDIPTIDKMDVYDTLRNKIK